ncbi:MAG TPA: cytochrome c oxidase subunit I [Caldilineae bacterium]|nr:cytochrome c oxidase subunit I [Caldilineae bacterium]
MASAPSAATAAAPKLTYWNASYTFRSWLLTTDHKRIAFLYLMVVSGFAAFGLTTAVILRLELFTPQQELFQDIYARLFTLHGGVMVYLFMLPAMLGVLGNFVIPLMIGAQNVAFPRLNLLTFYIYAGGSSVIVMEAAFGGSDAGWNFLAPYATMYTPSRILPALAIILVVGFSVFLMAVNLLFTVHRRRVKGLDWQDLPLTVWGYYLASITIIVGSFFLFIWVFLTATMREQMLGYVNYGLNLNPQLLVQSFWIFAQTSVYMMLLPAVGVTADIIETFARRPLVGRKGVEHAMVTLALLMSLSWGVHTFTSDQWAWVNLFFSFVAFLSAVPLAIIILSLFATIRKGHPPFTSPMVFAFAVLISLAVYLISGLALYSPATAQALLHTQFEWAHFHFLMVGVVLTAFLAGMHYWWPKATGRAYAELAGKVTGWTTLLGSLGAFGPGFLLGLLGMRARVVAYPEAWQMPNQFITMSTILLALGLTLPLLYFFYAVFWGEKNENPWDATTLEWRTTSPPPPENFTGEMLV